MSQRRSNTSGEIKLSSREREIMDVVYRLGRATATEIQAELADDLANATIRTLLRILEQKGHLKHRENGRQYVYSPVRPRGREARTALRRLVGVFYQGSVSSAVAGLIEHGDTNLSTQELDELERVIQRARESGEAAG
jgi:predicted transcriptional regulator